MVGTIIPMVHRARHRVSAIMAPAIYTMGSLLGASTCGALFGVLGHLAQTSKWQSSGRLLILGIASLLISLRECELLRVPIPQFRKQVPIQWQLLPTAVVTFLYGFVLGLGFGTLMSSAILFIPVLFCFLGGEWRVAALINTGFGLGRALPLVCFIVFGFTTARSGSCIQQLRSQRATIRLVNGVALATYGIGLTLLVSAPK
jgi:hypothetical protein